MHTTQMKLNAFAAKPRLPAYRNRDELNVPRNDTRSRSTRGSILPRAIVMTVLIAVIAGAGAVGTLGALGLMAREEQTPPASVNGQAAVNAETPPLAAPLVKLPEISTPAPLDLPLAELKQPLKTAPSTPDAPAPNY